MTHAKKVLLVTLLLTVCAAGFHAEELIQTAILLDTSSSMSGLITQAKTKLWKIVNELALAKRRGESPALEVAVYEYGNSGLSADSGYIRQVLPLTRDLDKVSESLFTLTTNGGSEYCGQVIERAARDLAWDKNAAVLKLVYIAGNEEFNQGRVDYKAACREAIGRGIIVNTIYCGDNAEGARTFWLAGAELADGQYFSIDQNAVTAYIKAPQDQEILKLNAELNKTYLAYGKEGRAGRELQAAQDSNAASSGAGVIVERSIAKSKAQYANDRWDLVDAVNAGKVNPAELNEDEMPAELRDKTPAEQKQIIEAKTKERAAIQKKISDLEKERRAFIAKEQKAAGDKSTLDAAILESVRTQAGKQHYTFEE